jgi:hypothetical protein
VTAQEKAPNAAVLNLVALFLLPVLACFLLVMLYGFYEQLDYWNKIPHDKLTTVYNTNWANGEYQTCDSFNQSSQDKKPELDCMTGEPPKTFKVRFWGRTFAPEKSRLVLFTWRCRKNGDSDPVITCEYQSEVKMR